MGGNPPVHRTREPVDSRNIVDPRDPAPVAETAGDLIGGVRTDVDCVVRRDEPHSRIKIALREPWKPFGESLGLSSH